MTNRYDWRWQQLRLVILRRDRYVCQWCGEHATEVDHVVALAEGGAMYDPANLVAACRRCNARRGLALVTARRARARGGRARDGTAAAAPTPATPARFFNFRRRRLTISGNGDHSFQPGVSRAARGERGPLAADRRR